MLTKILISVVLLLVPVQLRAQTLVAPPVSKTRTETAVSALEAVIAETGLVDNPWIENVNPLRGDVLVAAGYKVRKVGIVAVDLPV